MRSHDIHSTALTLYHHARRSYLVPLFGERAASYAPAMLARPRADQSTSFLCTLLASLLAACSGGSYSFVPTGDVVSSTSTDMMADVGTDDAATGVVIDVNVATKR